MYVWSKQIVIGLLAVFAILLTLFLAHGLTAASSNLKVHTTRWITLNYLDFCLDDRSGARAREECLAVAGSVPVRSAACPHAFYPVSAA